MRFSCLNGFDFLVSVFLENNKNTIDETRKTLLAVMYDVAKFGYADVMKIIINHPLIMINRQNMYFEAPIHIAIKFGNLNIV